MPLIEVYASWRDEGGKPQKQFITSVSSPAAGLSGIHMDVWLKDAVKAADHIERLNRLIPQATPEIPQGSPEAGKGDSDE